MPVKVEIDAYRFEELSGKPQDRARNWLVEVASEHGWWDSTYEHWIDLLKEKGINTDAEKITFRGFSSQGDGASFTGTIDVPRFMLAHGMVGDNLAVYAAAISGEDVWANLVRVSSGYVHDSTVSLESAGIPGDMEADMQLVCRAWMRKLYYELQKEYDEMTSDPALTELAEANEWMFDEQGRKI